MKKLITLMLIAFAAQAGLANNIAGGKDTITIELSRTLKINWSIKGSKVVQDSLFIKAKSSKKALKLELLELIPDATPLDFEACCETCNCCRNIQSSLVRDGIRVVAAASAADVTCTR